MKQITFQDSKQNKNTIEEEIKLFSSQEFTTPSLFERIGKSKAKITN